MIAVQSLWLADTGKVQDPDKWRASNAALRRHNPHTVFFGNAAAVEWAGGAGLVYDDILPLPDYHADMARAWSIGKLFAAAEAGGPFIHVDGDVILQRQLDVKDAPFFVQGREPWIHAPEWWSRLGVAPMPMPAGLWSFNFGVFGGSDWRSVGKACRTAHDFALENRFAIATACPKIMPAVVVEQIWVPALLAREGVQPRELLRPNHWREDFVAAGFEHWLPR
jgi:hypothetical protein